MSRLPLPNGNVEVVPSLLAADAASLRRDLKPLVAAGARWASVDVMDGHFVPNLGFGPDVIPALRKGRKVYLDAHLMVDDPKAFGPVFAKAGADWVTIWKKSLPSSLVIHFSSSLFQFKKLQFIILHLSFNLYC